MVLSKRQTGPLSQLPRLAIAPDQHDKAYVVLSSEQYHYLQRVRRLRPGDLFLVFDGTGCQWLARLAPQRSPIELMVASEFSEVPVSIHMGLAVIKGTDFESTLRSLTELGVQSITPLLTERTQIEPGAGKLERWQKIAREAAEQCERLQWPHIHAPQPWPIWLQQVHSHNLIMTIARVKTPHLWQILQRHPDLESIAVAVGPEGGWTDSEINQGLDHQAQLATLGPRILRAVTAPIVVASLITAAVETQASRLHQSNSF